MNKRTVTLGPVFLVTSASIVQALQASQKDYPHLPDSTQLEVDMNLLNDQSGVPAVVANNGQNTHKLFLYTPSYSLEVDEIDETKNGYRIKRIEPVNVQMYDRLAQGALSLSATRWHLCTQEKDILASQSSHWHVIEKEWQLLQEQIEQSRKLALPAPVLTHPLLPSHHERYLDLAASLIELTHTLKHEEDDVLLFAQREAVALLREGKAPNPYLLTALVDHRYQPYEAATIPLVAEKLSREQEEIMQKGLSVPDLLLVHLASQAEQDKALAGLIQVCSAKKQHVLLAAATSQRLDDVLGQLPEQLLSLHLDQQTDELSSDSTGARPARAWARQMRRQILEKTEAALPPLSRLAVSKKTIDQWIERLQRHIVTLSDEATKQQILLLRQRMSTIEQFISTPFQPALSELAVTVQQLEEHLTHQKSRLESFNERQATDEPRQKPALGRLFQSVDHLAQGWLKRQQAAVESLQAEYDARKQVYQQAQETMLQVVREDAEYAWCQQRIQEIEAEYAMALAEATKAVAIMQDTLRELIPAQPPLEPINELTLQHYLNWYTATRALLEQRYELLQEWRFQLSKYTEIVYPELLRYADVVGGTYADIVAAKALTRVEYDLVIVEDAGGMVLPDLLPLLVKARRAVLVGDPEQTMPFDQEAVQTRPNAEEITAQLTHSVFAQLWSSSIDAAHTVRPIAPVQDGEVAPVEEESHVDTSPLSAEEGKEPPDEQDEPARIIEEEVI